MKFTYLLSLCFCLILSYSSCQKEKIVKQINKIPDVNAGEDRTITLGSKLNTDTINLNGSATDADGSVKSYLWSQVSGPNSSDIQDPGSHKTLVRNIVEGIYVFQLMATDNEGATASSEVTITVKKAEEITITLKLIPNNNPYEVLIFGNNSGIDQTDVTPPEVTAATWTFGGNVVYVRSTLKFDLSAIPAGATIKSATLSLYSNHSPLNGNQVDANYGTDNSFLIQRISSDWVPGSLNWLNQPTYSSTHQVEVASTTNSFLDLPSINVKSLISDIYSSGNNYGLVIRLKTEQIYTSRVFYSSTASDESKRPKLVVKYSN